MKPASNMLPKIVDSKWMVKWHAVKLAPANLSGGDYTFHQESNNDGIWNESGKTLVVRVMPPLWERWWFPAPVLCWRLFLLDFWIK